VSADEAPPERLHPLALVSGLGSAARNFVGAIAAGGYFAFQGRPWLAVLMIGGIAAVTLVSLLLHWLRFSYRVGEDAVRIDSGILSRTQRIIPFDRIQDVSIAQGPLQRFAGVARVTLETGGSSGQAEEGLLSAIALARAEALRERVRRQRLGTGAVPGFAEPEEGFSAGAEAAPPPLFAMDLRRVLICGLFNFSLAVLAGLFGASQTVGDLLDIDPFERSFWEPLLLSSGLGAYLAAHPVVVAAGGFLVLLLTGLATGVTRTLLREYGFRLDRTGKGLRRRRGLLTRTDVTLPLRRIQAGVVATGPIRERFGWRAFTVQGLAGDGGHGKQGAMQRDHMLAPLATPEELAPIAAEIGWRLPGEDTAWRPVSRAHVWSFCLLLLPLFPLLLLLGPLRWLEWRRTAFAVAEEQLLLRTGWWKRRTLLLPLRNVQSVTLRETALTRRFGVAHLVVDIAGGSALGNVIPSLPRKEASLLRAKLLSKQP
jgi:putative membrane protein